MSEPYQPDASFVVTRSFVGRTLRLTMSRRVAVLVLRQLVEQVALLAPKVEFEVEVREDVVPPR